ncbi:hypothetical protein Clacol_001069 [Clathrus columnatus]|uniref:Uncharacterized protein n=1 Tax=Clathrus columnatus TaxID=1419009 RepID=A0AAV5A056_9AGAM|nr:hypothetical protein Clacol_001069 [Clathrus columnatus]
MDNEPKVTSVVPTTSINNSPDPSIKLPPIVRSGILHKNGGLEYDQEGVPYYKFPPFVKTTITGSTTVPFTAFKPNGLRVLLDLDEEQVDGLGIPTVQLEVKHEPGGKDAKKKRKYKKKLDVTFERRVMWWEDWEEGENLRRGDVSDINLPRVDRFAQGAADFQKNRKWTPTLQSVYDNFTQYVGLTGKTNQFIGKGFASAKRQAKELEEDLMDVEEDDDEAEFVKALKTDTIISPPLPPTSKEARIQELTAEYDAELERRELNLQAFLDDPESRMKIFFSSFYKNKGLFWSESKLRDGPILLRFFFKFFIRNRLMRDYENAFHKALAVIEKAAVELPLTTKISKSIPDDFGSACVAVWGKQMVEIVEKERQKMLELRQANKKETELPSDSISTSEDNANMNTDVNANTTGWGSDPFNTLSQTSENPSAWTPFEIPKQWDPTADSNPNAQQDSDPWGATPNPNADWALPPPPFLMSLLGGPIALPATHQVKLVEKSTRKVLSVEFSETHLNNKQRSSMFSGFAKVILAPWKDRKQKEGEKEGSILPPELHIINPPSTPSSVDDPTQRNISVYVSPSTSTMLRDATGLGLYGVFVKVGRVESPPVKQQESTPASKGKRKPKSLPEDPDSEFWYIEFLYEVSPSFWTESDEGFEEGEGSDDL